MQGNLIQTDARFCSNTTLSVKPSLTRYNKGQNSPLCSTPHFLDLALSPRHIMPWGILYIYLCLFICCLFPLTRYKFYEGRNPHELVYKHSGMEGEGLGRAWPILKENPTAYFYWVKIQSGGDTPLPGQLGKIVSQLYRSVPRQGREGEQLLGGHQQS